MAQDKLTSSDKKSSVADDTFNWKRAGSYLFILAIAILFAFEWGPGSRGCNQPVAQQTGDFAAKVNGREIPLKEFQQLYAQRVSPMRSQGLTDEMARAFGYPNQILDDMVKRELLAQAAEKEGIAASDKEILDYLYKVPIFQKDGVYDPETYRTAVHDYLGKTDIDFERDLRRELSGNKLLAVVESGATVSDDEVKAKYLREQNKASATVVKFVPAMFIGQVPVPKADELAAFEKSHEKEIADYYAANKTGYFQPERVRARHILIKVARDAPKEKQDEAKAKAENIRKDIAGGKDFAEMAKQFSEDVGTKEKGGDLGLNERATWGPSMPEFADAAFKMKAGELSQPVQTSLGWHVIKVEEVKPPETKELKDVSSQIAQELYRKEKAKDLAQAEAKKAIDGAKAGKKLTELYPAPKEDEEGAGAMMNRFKATKPEATDTGEFNSAADSLGPLGPVPDLMKQIFALDGPKLFEEPVALGDGGWAVVNITDRKKPSDADFTAQKDKLREDAINGKKYELREAFLKSLQKSAQIVKNENALAGPKQPMPPTDEG